MNDSRNKKSILGCCAGFFSLGFTLVGFIAVRVGEGVQMPSLAVPAKVLPSNNAFQCYVSAGRLVTNSSKISDSITSTSKTSLFERESLVMSNEAVLKMLRSGFSQEYMDPTPRYIFAVTPYFAQFRSLARLLQLQQNLDTQTGDWYGAVNSGLDAMQLGEDIPHGAPLLGRLTGVACQAIGRRSIWEYVDHLDARQSLAAVKRLELIRTHYTAYADTLQEEKYVSASGLKLLFRDKQSVGSAFPGQGNSMTSLGYSLFFLRHSKASIARNNQSYFDTLIATANRPYAEHSVPPRVPTDQFNQILVPDYGEAQEKVVESETQNGLLTVTLALHAFHIERGKYPQTLNELVPVSLSAVPADPFALSGTFKYQTSGDKYVLYSVGPDGIDDGGRPIDEPSKSTASNKNYRYYTFADSKGDIVAGKNIW